MAEIFISAVGVPMDWITNGVVGWSMSLTDAPVIILKTFFNKLLVTLPWQKLLALKGLNL